MIYQVMVIKSYADAFTRALDLFDSNSTNSKVMVMFTDGFTTAGGNPNTIATLAKSHGVIIYVIGLSRNGGIDKDALRDWASDPDSAYVAITPDDEDLEELFENLARNITKPGAKNITITDYVSDCFKITSIKSPSKGSVTMLDSNKIEWKIDELGVNKSEYATLEFTVTHQGLCSGLIEVNDNLTYEDDDDNIVTFPSPKIQVNCGNVVIEPCPNPVSIEIEGCSDSIEFDAGDLDLISLGRILQLDVTLKNICPNKRVALAILLNEVDDSGNETLKGMKALTIPAHTSESCRDILVKCVKFVLPDE